MLLHTLPLELPVARSYSRPRHIVDFVATPRVSIWFWLGPVAACEAAMAICAPALILLALPTDQRIPMQMLAVSLMSLAFWFMAAQSQQLYRPLHGSQAFKFAPLATTCLVWFFGVNLLLLALRPDITSGSTTVVLGAGMVFAAGMRLFWQTRLNSRLRAGRCIDRALVMAVDHQTARVAADELEVASGNCIRAALCSPLPGEPFGASVAWIEDAVCSQMIDQIYVVGSNSLSVAFTAILPQLAGLDIDVTLLSERSGAAFIPLCTTRVGGLYAIPLSSRAMGPVRAFAKRAMDMVAALLIIMALSPVLVVIAVAIKLGSPGPVLFAQRREGLRGNVFRVFKFRTMFTHLADEASHNQTSRHDSRVTPLGRVLRKLSLDEIPQLINVLHGDMSIVGPRPHPLGMTVEGRSLHDTLAEYRIRQRVKPGITGWAQVNGCRGEVTTQEKLRQRIALDCEYIERCSVAMDSWIMLRTVITLFFDRHAY